MLIELAFYRKGLYIKQLYSIGIIMIVKFRVKSGNNIIGYVAESNGARFFIKVSDTKLYSPTNVIKLKDSGLYKAKRGYRIETIDEDDLGITINNRGNTSVTGKPFLIYNTEFGRLSKKQRDILEELNKNSVLKIDKKKYNIKINMKDLSCLTAVTGLEYSLFDRNDTCIIIQGSKYGMQLDKKLSMELVNKQYKWVGHTHPGNTNLCLLPSDDDDYRTLKLIGQKQSVIFNSIGKYYVFEEGGTQ